MDPNSIIDHFGGLKETAKALGVSVQAVSNWRRRKTVPALRIYQLTSILRDKNEMLEIKRCVQLPGITGRRPKLTREQLEEVYQVTGSGKASKYGTVVMLAKKFGCCVKVITRARQQGYMLYHREDKIKSSVCA